MKALSRAMECPPMSTTSAPAEPFALPRLVTIGEVAESLSVSRQTIYNLIARKELCAIKIGSATRFAFDDIAAYIERQRTGVRANA
jgi:excisionase family DNA binding protein